jgi:hypothetical protein
MPAPAPAACSVLSNSVSALQVREVAALPFLPRRQAVWKRTLPFFRTSKPALSTDRWKLALQLFWWPALPCPGCPVLPCPALPPSPPVHVSESSQVEGRYPLAPPSLTTGSWSRAGPSFPVSRLTSAFLSGLPLPSLQTKPGQSTIHLHERTEPRVSESCGASAFFPLTVAAYLFRAADQSSKAARGLPFLPPLVPFCFAPVLLDTHLSILSAYRACRPVGHPSTKTTYDHHPPIPLFCHLSYCIPIPPLAACFALAPRIPRCLTNRPTTLGSVAASHPCLPPSPHPSPRPTRDPTSVHALDSAR